MTSLQKIQCALETAEIVETKRRAFSRNNFKQNVINTNGSAVEVLRWLDSEGPPVAQKWRSCSVYSGDPARARQWRSCGGLAVEVLQWLRSGDLAVVWKWRSCSGSEVEVQW
ncbi:unnamed protein product [Orchesella dallaii]|uniref:Uncharacterized protein n=1 Tax=Orchesella dallaii TaxID=48710 RepID=A0ABP1PM04_9HEXA